MDFFTKMATILYGNKQQGTKGKLNDGVNEGKEYMNMADNPMLRSQVAEITGMPIRPPQYGMLANRIARNKERQLGLLKQNPKLRGLLS